MRNNNEVWKQIGQDINGEASWNQSGYSVSLSSDGNIVAIGAIKNDGNGKNSGHVRVYQYNIKNNKWTQMGQNINGEAFGDLSGSSVSLSSDGKIVAIGAPSNLLDNDEKSGYVRVYQYVNKKWVRIGQDIDGEDIWDKSGYSVSLSSDGKIVAIGAPFNSNNSEYSGHVRVYQYNLKNNKWTQMGQDINGEAFGDLSGSSVSLSSDGNIVAIGAIENDGNGKSSGHVRVYRSVNYYLFKRWVQLGQDIDGEDIWDKSGCSVSLSSDGKIVAIGAPSNVLENDEKSGYVRVYQYVNKKWVQIGQDIDGEAIWDRSGSSVSLSSDGKIVAIGAPGNDSNNDEANGHVRVYQYVNNKWVQIGQDIDGEAIWDNSGFSVSLSSDGETVAVGAPRSNGNGKYSGHVRVYKLETEQNKRKIINNHNLEDDYTSLTNLGLIVAGIYAIRKILK